MLRAWVAPCSFEPSGSRRAGRTFRLFIEGEPLPTSYGEDLYGRIFGPVSESAVPARIIVSRVGTDYLHRWTPADGRKRVNTSIRRGANLMCLPLT